MANEKFAARSPNSFDITGRTWAVTALAGLTSAGGEVAQLAQGLMILRPVGPLLRGDDVVEGGQHEP